MKILFLCGREPSYPRNALMSYMLSQKHIIDLPFKKFRYKSITLRSLILILFSFPKIITSKYDMVFVGFLGNIIMLAIGKFSRAPIIFDAFISLYDTMCYDRKYFPPSSFLGRLAKTIDQVSCSFASQIIVDTKSSREYFKTVLGVPGEKINVIYVGCDDRIFYPLDEEEHFKEVLFFGEFLPIHGIDIILNSAKIVQNIDPEVKFILLGYTKKRRKYKNLSTELGLRNIVFQPPVPLDQLKTWISHAAVCLCGHFSDVKKAYRVIPGKIYPCMAMGKALIAGDNPANREILTHGKDAWMCEMSNPDELAKAILLLLNSPDLRKSLGETARSTYLNTVSNQKLMGDLTNIFQ